MFTAIGCVGAGSPSAIGYSRLRVEYDWSVVGKAKRHRVVVFSFFSPAVQTVHMFQVNKPGVDIGAAAFYS